MASSNKTQNLKLNQWALTDPVLMEDFNSDNQKLDAEIGRIGLSAESALSSNMMVKLIDVTTSVAAPTVSLDLSGIDMTRYAELKVYQDTGCTRNYMHYRINKITDSNYYLYLSLDTADWASVYVSYLHAYGGVSSMFLLGPNIMMHDISGNLSSSFGNTSIRKIKDVSAASLKSIDMIWHTSDSSGGSGIGTVNVPAGTRFTVVGVKKW